MPNTNQFVNLKLKKALRGFPFLNSFAFVKTINDIALINPVEINKTALTVLVIIKSTKFAVRVRFRCGSCKLKLCRYFTMFCDI